MFIATGAVILLLALLFAAAYPRTEFAGRYSESKFARIVPGMSAAQVTELVGHPLHTSGRSRVCTLGDWPSPGSPWDPPLREETWGYAIDKEGGPLDKGYRVRTVCLSNDVVVRVEKALVWQRWVWPGR